MTMKTSERSQESSADQTPGLAAALAIFFNELLEQQYREDFETSYAQLQQKFILAHELLRQHLMERFLDGLHELFSKKPVFADAKLLHDVLQDIGLERDPALYQIHEDTICSLRDLIRLKRQRELWLHRIDAKAARILLDPDISAGFQERRQAKVIAHISEAIRLMHEEFPLLPGRLVSEAKIQFWQRLERSWIVTHDQLARALLGFFYIPALAAAWHDSLLPLALLLSYPLGLAWVILGPRLGRAILKGLGNRRLVLAARPYRWWRRG